MEIIA